MTDQHKLKGIENQPEAESKLQSFNSKYWLTIISFISGTILIFLGFILIVLSNATKYLLKNLEEEVRDLIFLVVLTIGLILFIIGFLIVILVTLKRIPKEDHISSYLEEYYDKIGNPKKDSLIFSFPISRLISGILLIIMGFIDLAILTSAIGHHNSPYGQTIVLGGPSAFYPVALFPTIFGLGLLLYSLGSAHKISISQTENDFHFHEFRPHKTTSTSLEKRDIEAMRYQNNQIGPKFIWLIIILPIIVLTFINGTFYLLAPRLTDPTQGILFYYSAITESVVLFFLLLKPQQYWEIATKTDLYEYWIEPFSKDSETIPQLNEQIAKVFELIPDGIRSKNFIESNNLKGSYKDYTRIIMGLFFIVSSIPMWSFQILFGQFYYWFALFFGSMCIIRGISRDFSDGDLIEYNNIFKFKRSSKIKWLSKFYYYRTFDSTYTEITKKFRKLDFFDVTILPTMILFMGVQIVQAWFLSSSLTLILSSFWSTLFMVLVISIILFYTCVPIDQIKVKSPSITYFLPVILKEGKQFNLTSAMTRELRKTLMIRLLTILITLIGTIIGTMIYLSLN